MEEVEVLGRLLMDEKEDQEMTTNRPSRNLDVLPPPPPRGAKEPAGGPAAPRGPIIRRRAAATAALLPVPTPLPSTAPSVHPTPLIAAQRAKERRKHRRARSRLVARAAPRGAAIIRLLRNATAANGGRWPKGVHAEIAEALGLPRSAVRRYLGRCRWKRGEVKP